MTAMKTTENTAAETVESASVEVWLNCIDGFMDYTDGLVKRQVFALDVNLSVEFGATRERNLAIWASSEPSAAEPLCVLYDSKLPEGQRVLETKALPGHAYIVRDRESKHLPSIEELERRTNHKSADMKEFERMAKAYGVVPGGM